MGILTNRLSLFLAGGGSSATITPPDVADIDKINDNFRKLDDAAGFTLVTSTTRPSTPFNGQAIAEVDTGNRLVWTPEGYRGIGTPKFSSKEARDALLTGALQGDRCHRSDLGFDEVYYAAYNASTNPAGAAAAGWYPAPGTSIFMGFASATGVGSTTERAVGGAIPWTTPYISDPLNITVEANRNKLLPKYLGYYWHEAAMSWSGNSTGSRFLTLRKNEAAVRGGFRATPAQGNAGGSDSVRARVLVDADTDYLDATVSHSATSVLNVGVDVTLTYIRPRRA